MNSDTVTIIMRTKNNEEIITQTLKALFSQSYGNFKLHVIDSGSRDKTCSIVEQFPSSVSHIHASSYFPGKVLNEAIENCTTDLIVFLNSDTVLLTPDALEKLIKAFDDPNVQAAFGRQIPRPDAELWVRRDYAKSFPEGRNPSWMHLSLPLAAVRRTAWLEHHFYTDAWGSEDTEWGYWAKQMGYKVAYVPDAMAMHSHNYTLKQLYGRRFIEGEADAFIYKQSYSLMKMALQIAKSTVVDGLAYLKSGDVIGMLKVPLLRFVYFWAYWKGHSHGNKRRKNPTLHAEFGQRVVLDRHDAK